MISKIRILFYALWFTSLLLQAFYTGLTADEAYYWMYSRQLAWGYFDHPPFVALMIRLGYSLFSNELGVRLVPVVFSTLTIALLEKLIQPRELKSFFMLVASVGILHFVGFMALPDSPLLFFLAAYLLLYKSFATAPDMRKAFFLGCVAAMMCLSKYHGIIIIGLTVLSNPKWLVNRYFWFAALVGLILLAPHILWQVEADFPSIRYHLFERSREPYHFSYTLEYVLTQLFVLGPLTGILFFIAAAREKAKDIFERALRFLFWGGYLFFFLMSFKGRVEGHWTLYTVLPGLYFAYRFWTKGERRKRVLSYVFWVSISLIVAARLLIVVDFKDGAPSVLADLTKPFHNREDMLAIKRVAGDLPVAFMNSYQKASLYTFYSGSEGFSLNNVFGRKNQFDIWNAEDTYRGRTIMLIPNYDIKGFERIPGVSEELQYTFIENFQSFSSIRIDVSGFRQMVEAGDTLHLTLRLTAPANRHLDLSANPDLPVYLYYEFFEGEQVIKKVKVRPISNELLDKPLSIDVVLPGELPAHLSLAFSLKAGWLPLTMNSRRYVVL